MNDRAQHASTMKGSRRMTQNKSTLGDTKTGMRDRYGDGDLVARPAIASNACHDPTVLAESSIASKDLLSDARSVCR